MAAATNETPMTLTTVRRALAKRLESGGLSFGLARSLARVHAYAHGWPRASALVLARPLVLPPKERARVVTVGGATLGGSGKTRVALACAKELARLGARVALVGHAYRAEPKRARVVGPSDDLGAVGDEALACARSLAPWPSASVVVAPSRQAALDHAVARGADVVVVDGPLQTRPVRAALALLAVDASEPWGSGELFPTGDLRAPREALIGAADRVVAVSAAPGEADVERLRGRRFGLFTAMARPARLVRALAERGLAAECALAAADHGPLGGAELGEVRALEERLDLWGATPKCAIHLERHARRPIHVLDDAFDLPRDVAEAVRELFA